MSFVARLSTRFHFESAHFMPHYPEGHPNRALHGHSYVAEVVVESQVDPRTGMVMDAEDLSRACKEIAASLDHKLLNEVPGLSFPTGEFIAKWIYEKMKPGIKGLKEVIIIRDTVGIRIAYSEEMQK